MIISASEIRNDTYYFFSKQIGTIFFISILVALIGVFINMCIKPDMHITSIIENNKLINANTLLDLINNMNLEEKNELLRYSVFKIIELLLNKTLLLGSIIALIFNVSNNQKELTISLLSSFFKSLPSLFLLNFLTTFFTQLGFMLFVVPGILLTILLSLSPIILSFKQHSLIESIRLSIYISWRYIKIIGSGIVLWMFSKFFVTSMLSNLYFFNANLTFLILNTSINILYSLLIIYLFRFYMIFISSQKLNDM